jgi:hypothetical protein
MIRVPLTRATDFHKDRVTTKFWFTCLLASGADTEEVQVQPEADTSFVPKFSRARAIRDVRQGKLGVCDASKLLGSPPDDYHERAFCAIPECFQCAALALFEPDCATSNAEGAVGDGTIDTEEPHGATPESMRVAALIHLTPGIEQRALVRYASKFAHCADALTSLEAESAEWTESAQSAESAESVDVEPEHRRALCAHLRRLRGVA